MVSRSVSAAYSGRFIERATSPPHPPHALRCRSQKSAVAWPPPASPRGTGHSALLGRAAIDRRAQTASRGTPTGTSRNGSTNADLERLIELFCRCSVRQVGTAPNPVSAIGHRRAGRFRKRWRGLQASARYRPGEMGLSEYNRQRLKCILLDIFRPLSTTPSPRGLLPNPSWDAHNGGHERWPGNELHFHPLAPW